MCWSRLWINVLGILKEKDIETIVKKVGELNMDGQNILPKKN